MSIAINPDEVVGVVLTSGQEYEVELGSFYIDAYEFLYPRARSNGDDDIVHGGGQSGVCAAGFSFRVTGKTSKTHRVAGPLTAIAAVVYVAEK